MPKEKELYVGIVNPVESRKALLESSKEAIKALQGFERLRKVRDEKELQIAKVSSLVSEISVVLEELKKQLPEYAPEDLPKQKVVKNGPVDDKAQKRPKLSDVQKLEMDLTSIEEKLKRL